MAGPLDTSGRAVSYTQRSKRYFLDKTIYDKKVVERLIFVESAEWTIDEDTLREHLERLRRLQQNSYEDISITEEQSGVVIVERRMDRDYCRIITTYTPEGVEARAEPESVSPADYLHLHRILERINGRRQHFE